MNCNLRANAVKSHRKHRFCNGCRKALTSRTAVILNRRPHIDLATVTLELWKKRQTLNVIPMEVAHQHIETLNRGVKSGSEVANASAKIEDQRVFARRGNRYTRGVTPIALNLRTVTWSRPPHPVERDCYVVTTDSHTLIALCAHHHKISPDICHIRTRGDLRKSERVALEDAEPIFNKPIDHFVCLSRAAIHNVRHLIEFHCALT